MQGISAAIQRPLRHLHSRALSTHPITLAQAAPNNDPEFRVSAAVSLFHQIPPENKDERRAAPAPRARRTNIPESLAHARLAPLSLVSSGTRTEAARTPPTRIRLGGGVRGCDRRVWKNVHGPYDRKDAPGLGTGALQARSPVPGRATHAESGQVPRPPGLVAHHSPPLFKSLGRGVPRRPIPMVHKFRRQKQRSHLLSAPFDKEPALGRP